MLTKVAPESGGIFGSSSVNLLCGVKKDRCGFTPWLPSFDRDSRADATLSIAPPLFAVSTVPASLSKCISCFKFRGSRLLPIMI